MKSWIAVVAVALILAVGAVTVGAFVQDEKVETEAVMKGLFKGKTAKFNTVLKKQVEAKPTDWEAIQKTTKEIATLGGSLVKGEPAKGDKESFKKLAGKLGENTKALHDAAEAKDLAKVEAAQKTIQTSCKSCHSLHRGQ
jgi:cytochrome c556